MTVRITEDDFDILAEHEALKSPDAGAIVTFTGTVRDLPDGGLNSMTLEHYPGMTEQEIENIILQAEARWPDKSKQLHDIETGLDLGAGACLAPPAVADDRH